MPDSSPPPRSIGHWVSGRPVARDERALGTGARSGARRAHGRGRLGVGGRGRRCREGRRWRRPRSGACRRSAAAPRRSSRCASSSMLTARSSPPSSRASTARCGRRRGRDRPRPRVRRVRLRHPAPAQGVAQLRGGQRRRRAHGAAAGRGGGRHHPVQLPGDGAAVDARQRPGVRQRLRAEALGEGPVPVAPPGRARAGGGVPGRRLQRGPRRRRGGQRPPHPPRHRRGVVRRKHTGRPSRLRDGHRARQAGAGARWGQEPHGRAARRRRRRRRRLGDLGGLRLGRRALHGHLGGGRRRRGRRPARRRHRRPHPRRGRRAR